METATKPLENEEETIRIMAAQETIKEYVKREAFPKYGPKGSTAMYVLTKLVDGSGVLPIDDANMYRVGMNGGKAFYASIDGDVDEAIKFKNDMKRRHLISACLYAIIANDVNTPNAKSAYAFISAIETISNKLFDSNHSAVLLHMEAWPIKRDWKDESIQDFNTRNFDYITKKAHKAASDSIWDPSPF